VLTRIAALPCKSQGRFGLDAAGARRKAEHGTERAFKGNRTVGVGPRKKKAGGSRALSSRPAKIGTLEVRPSAPLFLCAAVASKRPLFLCAAVASKRSLIMCAVGASKRLLSLCRWCVAVGAFQVLGAGGQNALRARLRRVGKANDMRRGDEV
jgi:hypothetical protein